MERKVLQMLSQQQIEAIILYHLYGESEAAAKRFREAVTNAAKEIAAQQSVQATKARCICVDFINCNPDPVSNPDCPIHGSGFRA